MGVVDVAEHAFLMTSKKKGNPVIVEWSWGLEF